MNDRYKIAVRMEHKLYQRVLARAKHEKKSFSTMAAELVSIGLFDLEEAEGAIEVEMTHEGLQNQSGTH